jgi:hypothetical protein
MKHLQTFESFTGSLNENKDFGDMTAAISGGNAREFSMFMNKAKRGDTFMYAPNGVELDYINKKDLGKDTAEVSTLTTSRDAKPVNCTVEMVRDGVALTGGSMDWDGDEEETVLYFKMAGSNEIFVLTNTFY